MPTGYTAAIKDGISFEKYAMDCARAFGACVDLREESGGGERIPEEFAPSDYHAKAAKKAHDELAELMALTREQCERRAAKAWDDAETRRVAMLDERSKLREAYEAMLAKVRAWTPPTPEHAGLHEFMRTQIEQSIDFDCGGSYGTEPTPRITGVEWADHEEARLKRAIAYHEKEHAGEVERAASRTAWVKALRNAL